MQRRRFLKLVAGSSVIGVVGCDLSGEPPLARTRSGFHTRAGEGAADDPAGFDQPDADVIVDAGTPDAATVLMHDTYAQALYFGGELGPLTGIIRVDYLLVGEAVTLDFWHGHGGMLHQYTLLPEHYQQLKQLERVYIETSVVQSHQHMLFIDPVDPRYKVPGSEPVPVPL